MTSQFAEISNQFKDLQEKYNLYLSKVDPALINDLLLRQIENPSVIPLFMVEIFIKSDAKAEDVRASSSTSYQSEQQTKAGTFRHLTVACVIND
ncbi:MAG: hypothetical protein ACRD5E_11140 [Nitrososphaeraceae archaeon]